MQNELDAYFEYLRSARQLSGHSLDGYRRDLNKLLAHCEREHISEWSALQGRHLRQLVGDLHRQGQSSRSLARLLSSVRGLYRYLNQEGICQHDPAAGLSAPKGERRLPKLLDTDRAMQLLDGGVEVDFHRPCVIRRCSSCSIHPACACRNWSA